MMPLNHILKKLTGGYKLSKSQENVNQLMYMNDIKLSAKTEKRIGNHYTRKLCNAKNEKRKRTLAGRNGIIQSSKK